MSPSSNQSGFSLLEMTIVLAIMGVLSGLALPFLSQHMERIRHQTTKEHQKEIMDSIEIYFSNMQSLPCPADPVSKGKARPICQTTSQEAIGIIPYRTLGLPESVARDGFGYYMTYAVHPDLTKHGAGDAHQSFADPKMPKLIITDESGDSVLVDTPDQNSEKGSIDVIAYVLVSHGPGGNGAYTGKRRPKKITLTPTSNDEKENNNGDLKFRTKQYSTNPENLFRHKLVWRTQKKLYRTYDLLQAHDLLPQNAPKASTKNSRKNIINADNNNANKDTATARKKTTKHPNKADDLHSKNDHTNDVSEKDDVLAD